SRPVADIHCGSRWRPKRAAAWAHWSFRWLVGATTTRRWPGSAARCRRAAVKAKVVLPAPGVATARKSGPGGASSRSSASFCHLLSRIDLAMGPATLGRPRAPPAPCGERSRATLRVALRACPERPAEPDRSEVGAPAGASAPTPPPPHLDPEALLRDRLLVRYSQPARQVGQGLAGEGEV